MKKKIIKILRFALIGGGTFSMFMFLAPILGRIFNLGTIIGVGFSSLLIIAGAWWNKLGKLFSQIKSSKKGKLIFNTVSGVFISCVLIFAITLTSVIAGSYTNADEQETIIVLGCAVYNEMPSLMLKGRTRQAKKYLLEHTDCVAVLSGGQGQGEGISEAECMKRILVDAGIEPERLYLEDKSTNTDENIKFSKEIIDANGLSENIAIVSSNFHLKRATMIAKRYSIDARVIASRASFFIAPTFFVRDTIAVIREFIFR